ncbi:MAG TPA: carboxypeptidase regulatory-like domain-containing protein [Actinomycetota bacterium]|nr:carboxypeptidase regulatory-like domain-containing protein [Actinomycetota bacterium]
MTRVLRQLRSASRRSGDEAGFTMVEMMMAIFIFGIVITGLAVGMTSSLNLTRQNRNRSIAANLASQQMDTIRSMDFDDLNDVSQQAQPTTTTSSVDGVPYTLSQYTRWVYKSETGATPGPCQAPPSTANPLAYISVLTSVSWTDMRGVPPVTSSTVVTPPVGIYDSTDGHIAVTVLTSTGAPAQGVTVSIASTGVADSAVTSSDGCAFFAFEPIGVYTVSLSGTGMVDGQGNAAPPQTVTVKAGSTSTVQFQYDSASSLILTLSGNGGYAVPNAVPISLGNTHLLPSGVKSVTGSGNPRTITGLFPYADGYQVWAGSCSDADPQGVNPSGSAFFPGATRSAAIVMTPGQSSSGSVQMPALQVTVMKGATLKSGYTVTATHVVPSGATSDAGCPTAEAYTLGTSNGSGLVSMALPFGTWKITATSGSSTGNANVTLSPLNANNPATLTVTVS